MSHTPFGIATVNEDPDGDGISVENNFRFPGQYFDAETGLNYNYFRTYDPTLGRYTQSDPIGLAGGLNMFGYVDGNPVVYMDVYGLVTIRDIFPRRALAATQAGAGVASAASLAFGPGGIIPAAVFGGISAAALGAEIVIYSEYPYTDVLFFGLKKIMPKNHFVTDKITEKGLDFVRDAIKENERSKPCK